MTETIEARDLQRAVERLSHLLQCYGPLGVSAVVTVAADDLALVLSDYERMQKALEWQPIDSAPRDGTRILAVGGGLADAVEVVDYYAKVGCWNTPDSTLDDRDDEPQGYNRPTHWMPLPTPPALKGEG